MDKKAINEKRATLIADTLSDPVQRKILYAKMWFPMERYLFPVFLGETEEQWADRKIAQLQIEREKFEKNEKRKGKQ